MPYKILGKIMEEELDYFKVYKDSPLYKAIINYMRNRNDAAVDYINKNFSHLPATDIETYKTEIAKFYENYPPLFNKEVCHEEI